MKRLTVIAALIGAGTLGLLVIFIGYAASSPESKSDKISIELNNETGIMPKVNQSGDMAARVTRAYTKIDPLFDATGAVVSDPTGAILNGSRAENMANLVRCPNVKIAPVFDATGAVVSDPTGTMFNAINP